MKTIKLAAHASNRFALYLFSPHADQTQHEENILK